MRKVLTAVAVLMALVGCASVSQIAMKDDKPLYSATCRHSPDTCYALAAKTCGDYFDTIGQSDFMWEYHIQFQCKPAP